MADLQERGWQLGLRFDPLIYTEGYLEAEIIAFCTEEIRRHVPEEVFFPCAFGGEKSPPIPLS